MAIRKSKSQPAEMTDADEQMASNAEQEPEAGARRDEGEPAASSGGASVSSSLEASYRRKKADAEARLGKTDQDLEKLEADYKRDRAKLVERKQNIAREINAIERDFKKRQSEQSEKKLTEFVRGLIGNTGIDAAALADPTLRDQIAELLKKAAPPAVDDQADSTDRRSAAGEMSSAAD